MNKKTLWIVALGALLLAALACGPVAATPTPTPPPTNTPAPTTVDVTIVNQTGQTICYVYISLSTDTMWGEDRLGDTETIANGASATVTGIAPGTYDMRADDCNQNALAEEYGLVLTPGAFTWTVTGTGSQIPAGGGTAGGALIDPSLPVFDAGDGYETTVVQMIQYDQPAMGTFNSLFEAHNWLFQGTAGETVTIMATGRTGELDTRAKLIDPNGNLLAEEDDTEDVNPLIVYTLPANGLYTIRLDTWETGDYVVGVSNTGGAGMGTTGAQSGQTVNQFAVAAIASSQYGDDGWSATQATGAPDTAECGDYTTAWASETATGQDWLHLFYATPVIPTEIIIYETYNPGALVRVEVVDVNGNTYTAWEGSAWPPEGCPQTSSLQVTGITAPINQVILYLDQTITNDWSEIDAVELIGTVP